MSDGPGQPQAPEAQDFTPASDHVGTAAPEALPSEGAFPAVDAGTPSWRPLAPETIAAAENAPSRPGPEQAEQLLPAPAEPLGPGQPGWELFELARACLVDPQRGGSWDDGQVSSLLLNRAICSLLMRAELVRAGVECKSLAGDECWRKYAELPSPPALIARYSEDQRKLIESCLSASGESLLAYLAQDERLQASSLLGELAKTLAEPLAASLKPVTRSNPARWVAIGAAIAVLGVGSWLGLRSSEPGTNLALHRPVHVVTPHPVHGRNPQLLVDGNLKNLGFHTIDGTPNQHVTIDLGKVQSISRVVVFNRADCCQARAVPLQVELSEDGESFHKVAERTENFTRWDAEFSSTKARHVRLTHLSTKPFHLSEVEVY